MTDAPEDIPKFVGDEDQLMNAMNHMLTRNNLTGTDKAVIKGAVELIEELNYYIMETCGHV